MNEEENTESEKNNTENGQEKREAKPITITDIEFDTLKKDANEFKHKYLHLLADLENAHKRLQKERMEIAKYSTEMVIIDFLTPIDHLESALKHVDNASNDVKHWALGFRMILTQFQEALKKNGVIQMESVGKQFDPHHHEAIEMVVSNEFPPGTIIEENLKGYKIGTKTIRPARVKVAQAESNVSNGVTEENETNS